MLTSGDVDELESLAQTSPGLTEARLLAAGAARTLKDRARALRILRDASARDQDDPRFAQERFLVELETGTLADAAQALGVLEARVPGDLRVTRGHARLLVREGKPDQALEMYRRLLRERPSWRNLWSLANLEIDLGDETQAREHLRQLLEISPRNPRGRAKLAELEWTLADPAQAARIYQDLLEDQVTQENVANLGWSLLLAGDHSTAAGAYELALELRPEDLRSRLNLGIAREGLGDASGARLAYRELLARAASREAAGTLTASERLLKAQAMARLGETVPAVELTMQALDDGDRSPQQVFQAALIYALCGDTNHAIVHAREARRRLSPSWFRIPGFESVRAQPAFQELLTTRP